MTLAPCTPSPSRPPHRPLPPGRRPLTSRMDHRQTNDRLLEQMACCSDPARRRRLCDSLVRANLPLVRAVASRQGASVALPHDERLQLGCIGLVRALMAFDPRRGRCFSSFAVPYVVGAMRQEWRDRGTPVRVPRSLWDLEQRRHQLQEQRRRRGLEPLSDAALGSALGQPEPLVQEARLAPLACRALSLDAPAPGQGPEGDPQPLIEQLADPHRPAAAGAEPSEPIASAAARRLWRRVQALPTSERELLLGRHLLGCTWVELGERLGVSARQAQRIGERLVRQLRQSTADPGCCGGDQG